MALGDGTLVRLIVRDTVEEKILQVQQGKRNLAEAIIKADASLMRKHPPHFI